MSLVLPRTINILFLFSCVLTRPLYIEAQSLNKTIFLVGPDPQPIVLDGGYGDAFSPPHDVLLPVASVPISGEKGKRNLKGSTFPVPKAYQNVGPRPRHFLSRKTEEKSSSQYLPSSNLTDSEPRLLVQDAGTITTTFLGSNNDDNGVETGFYWFPPDPIGAAGARRLVAVVNSLMEVRFKNGALVFRDGLQSFFFSSYPEASDPGDFVDPKVIWDEHMNRFVIVALQTGFDPNFSRIWYAVSQDDTPDYIKDWHKGYINAVVNIDGEDAWVDYTGLEVDEEAVYITANMFTFSGNYGGVRLWVLDKDPTGGLYKGGPLSYYVVNPFARGGLAGTTMPTQVHGSLGVDGSVGTFLVSVIVHDEGRVDLEIVTIFNPLGSPKYTIQLIDLGIITQRVYPPPAPQLGSTAGLSFLDFRVMDAVWRSNQLWVVLTINPPSGVNQDQATVHWIRCKTSRGKVTLEAQGDLGGEDIAPGTHTYMPSVAVNTQGVVAFGYAASSPTTYVGAYASVGTSEQSIAVKRGLAPYGFGSQSESRWGDYSGLSVDPEDDSFWVFHEFADTAWPNGDGRWGTVWARMVPLPTDCSITWNLYNARTDVKVASLSNGATIRKPPPCGQASIQVVAPCAAPRMKVGMELFQGNRLVARRKESKYYFLFGMNGGDILGGKIAAGSYGIRAIVNGTTSPFTNFTLGGNCA